MIIEKGTKVLIFKYIDIANIKSNYDKFIVGKIINMYNEKPNIEMYEICGSDGKIYKAVHLFPKIGVDYYVRTQEEHISILHEYMINNQQKRQQLDAEDTQFRLVIEGLNENQKNR